jgi:hypothetical protein
LTVQTLIMIMAAFSGALTILYPASLSIPAIISESWKFAEQPNVLIWTFIFAGGSHGIIILSINYIKPKRIHPDWKMTDTVQLGGNIELTGFSELDGANVIVVKKIVGSYARKISDHRSDFSKLRLTLKAVHKQDHSEKFELHGQVLAGNESFNAEITDRNLYVVIDSVMKKLCNEIGIK